MKCRTSTNQTGSTLVEVLVAIGISAIMLPTLAGAFISARAAKPQSIQQLQAASMLRETTEAVRVAREASWTNVATNGTYHPVISGNTWALAAGAETVSGTDLTREIVISDSARNVSGQIVTSGGTVDPSTKHVVITVSWDSPLIGSVVNDMYLSRWRGNTSWVQTTQADFNTGTVNGTVTTATGGGQVQLAAGSAPATWAAPAQVGALDISGTTDGNDVYVDSTTNRAYVVNGATLSIVDISNPTAPALLGTYNAAAVLMGVYVVGNFAYLASANNTAELTVVNVTAPAAPTLAGSLNLGDNADATSVFVTGGFAYVGKLNSATAGVNEFYVVNVSVPASPTLSGSLNIAGNVNSIYVSGNYAYLATGVTTAELTIINVSSKTAPVIVGSYDAAGTVAATDVFVVGSVVYMSELSNAGGAEFFIIDVTTPSNPTLSGSYEAGANINGVYVSGTQAYLATAITSRQFTILDVSNPAALTVVGSTNLASATNDIFVSGSNAYLASSSNTAELTVVAPGVSAFQFTGTFESRTFDATATAGYNNLSFTITEPANTNIQFQVATNNDNATWNYVGPDGTAATYFTTSGAIPFAAANGRYIRYKTFFTSNGTVTPTLSDTRVNYSL